MVRQAVKCDETSEAAAPLAVRNSDARMCAPSSRSGPAEKGDPRERRRHALELDSDVVRSVAPRGLAETDEKVSEMFTDLTADLGSRITTYLCKPKVSGTLHGHAQQRVVMARISLHAWAYVCRLFVANLI
jgi:hypothetical protein